MSQFQKTIGLYVTVLGYNFGVSRSSDGTLQLSSMPQLSVGGSVAVNIPIITRNSDGTWVYGPDKSTNKPSSWAGGGTPSGLPGPTFSILQELGDGRQVLVQVGGGINDFFEAGVSFTIPNEVIQEIPNPDGPFPEDPWFGSMPQNQLLNDPLVRTIEYVPVDPLVLDLDGDGLEITGLSQRVLFDGDADGIKTNSAWVGRDDALLVWDRNGNGLIDSGRELFGDETVLANGQKAAHGFAALSELDGNGDGRFDASDAAYTQVRLWRDLNQDGVSQANELFSLSDLGVKSINLNSTGTRTRIGDSTLVQRGSFERADGSIGEAGSFLFDQNRMFREFTPMEVSEAATSSPHLVELCRAVGNRAVEKGEYAHSPSWGMAVV